jgi:hypothetical protein
MCPVYVPLGIAAPAVTLCDRGHATMPESVEYADGMPFGPRHASGIHYVTADMVPSACDPHALPRHSSLRSPRPECAR